MTKPIDLRPDHAAIVQEVLARHLPAGVSVRVFGSRAKWTAKTFSDLDLAVKGKEKLPYKVMVELADAFEESDLPFRVDVVDWHAVTPSFQAVIDRDGVALPLPAFPVSTLGDRIGGQKRIIGGPFGSNLTAADYRTVGVPVIRGSNMEQDGRWIGGEFAFVSEEKASTDLRSNTARRGDIIVTQRGTMGQVSIIRDDDSNEKFVISQSQMAISVDENCACRDFVYYYLRSPQFTEYLTQSIIQTGVPHINLGILRQAPTSWPNRDFQEVISGQLSILDNKIELNRRMNETLEGMAQAIFRDWFVDFGPVRRKAAGETDAVAIMGGLTPDPIRAAELAALFPDAFGDDGLPLGWQRLHLSDIASQGKGSVNPQGQPETVFEHYSLPAFDKGQEPSMDVGSTIKSNKTPVPTGAILLSKLNPEILRVWLPNDHAGAVQIASTEFLVFFPKPGASRSLLFALFRDPDFRTLMQGMVTGTSKSHQRISPPALMAQEVIAADVGLFPAFSALVEPMLERLLASRAENKSLAETRDYLLPRLMSGTVRVARESEAA